VIGVGYGIVYGIGCGSYGHALVKKFSSRKPKQSQ
jgi:isopentenyl phosphate kinase